MHKRVQSSPPMAQPVPSHEPESHPCQSMYPPGGELRAHTPGHHSGPQLTKGAPPLSVNGTAVSIITNARLRITFVFRRMFPPPAIATVLTSRRLDVAVSYSCD